MHYLEVNHLKLHHIESHRLELHNPELHYLEPHRIEVTYCLRPTTSEHYTGVEVLEGRVTKYANSSPI
jgi:hypothetical protein